MNKTSFNLLKIVLGLMKKIDITSSKKLN